MIASILAFFSGIFQLLMFGLVIFGGFLVVLGFMSAKGMFHRLKNGDMFKGGNTNYDRGYHHGSCYNDGYDNRRGHRDYGVSRRRHRDYDCDREYDDYSDSRRDLSQASAEHFEYELGRQRANKRNKVSRFGLNLGGSKFLNKFKTKESFEEYIKNLYKQDDSNNVKLEEDYVVFDGNKESTIDSVKDILGTIYNNTECIVCGREGIVTSVQTLQSGDVGSIKALQESSLRHMYNFGNLETELFILVKKKDFSFANILQNDNPRDFLEKQINVKVDKSVCSTLIKTSIFDFQGDVHGCRFIFAGELQSSAESIARNVTKGNINRSVVDTIQKTESEDICPIEENSTYVTDFNTKLQEEECGSTGSDRNLVNEVSDNSGITKISQNIDESLDSVKTIDDNDIKVKPSEFVNTAINIGKIGDE